MNAQNPKSGDSAPSTGAENGPEDQGEPHPTTDETALIRPGGNYQVALKNAIQLWAESNTAGTSHNSETLIQAKTAAVLSFFRHSERELADVKSMDVRNWREWMEGKGHKP